MDYDVFISYRRESGAAEARLLRQSLIAEGIRVFLDVTDLHKGYFDQELLRRIAATPNFLVVLTPGALDRCDDPQDWMRQEIAQAIREQRNILPVMVGTFQFPPSLPEDLATLPRHQGVHYSHQYFDAMTRSILDGLDLPGHPVPRPSRDPDSGAATRVDAGPWHWSHRLVGGLVAGLAGGAVNALVLAQSLTVDTAAVLLVCGALPGAIGALAVGRTRGILPRIIVAAVAAALAIDLLFLGNFLILGASAAEFNHHLPFWLGPGDDRIMMGEAFMLGPLLGLVPAILGAFCESWWNAWKEAERRSGRRSA